MATIQIIDGKKVVATLRAIGKTQAELAQHAHLPEFVISEVVTGKPVTAEIVYRVSLSLQQMTRLHRKGKRVAA